MSHEHPYEDDDQYEERYYDRIPEDEDNHEPDLRDHEAWAHSGLFISAEDY